MKELHDRINRIINTDAFEKSLGEQGIDLFDFQCSWTKESHGSFDNLPQAYKDAIIAGEQELAQTGELSLA